MLVSNQGYRHQPMSLSFPPPLRIPPQVANFPQLFLCKILSPPPLSFSPLVFQIFQQGGKLKDMG